MNNTTSTNFFHWFWNIYLEDTNQRAGFVVATGLVTLLMSFITAASTDNWLFLKLWLGAVILGLVTFITYASFLGARHVWNKYREWRTAQLERTMDILRS